MNTQKSLSERVVELSLMEEGTKVVAAGPKREAAPKGEAAPEPEGATIAGTPAEAVDAGTANRPVAFGKARDLDDMNEEGRHLILTASETMTRLTLVDLLAAQGIKTSASTLQRRLKKWRAEEALADGADLRAAADEFAARGKVAETREGALAAAREKVFEGVLSCKKREEALQFYESLAGEDERLKRLELEEKKAQMQERALELQERRLRIAAGRNGAELFLEALRILGDEGVDDRAKVERARATLERWRAGVVIDVEAEARDCKLQIGK